MYVRTCQECGYELARPGEPKNKDKPAFLNRVCPKCHSEAFDYGSWRTVGEEADD